MARKDDLTTPTGLSGASRAGQVFRVFRWLNHAVPLALILIIFAVLGALPILRVLATAIALDGVLGLGNFIDVVTRASTVRALWHTLDTALFGAILALAIGGPFAFLVTLTDMPARRTIGFLLLLPLMIAPQVMALSWLYMLGPSSALLGAVGLAPPPGTTNPLLGRTGIILLYGIQHAPIVYISLRSGLVGIPRDLIEAARASGSGPLRTIFEIIAPLIRPYLLTAMALAFVSGLGNFGIPALLGMPVNYQTLTTLIYQRLSSFGPSSLPDVAAIASLIGMLCLLGVVVQALLLGGYAHRMHRGATMRFSLGAWGVPAAIGCGLVLTLILILPTSALVTTSLIPAFGVPLTFETATLSSYVEVLFVQAATSRAFINSFLLSGTAAIALAVVAVPIAAHLERRNPHLRQALAAVAELPYAVPGIVLAIACILLFLRPLPLIGSLYATLWIILIAYLMRFFTLALKSVVSAISQIPREFDEAAAAAGASSLTRLATITAPIAAPAAVGAALLIFMSAFNELTVSALLWSGGKETIGVILFSLSEAGLGPQAAAIGVTTIAVVVLLLIGLDRLGRKLPSGVLPWR